MAWVSDAGGQEVESSPAQPFTTLGQLPQGPGGPSGRPRANSDSDEPGPPSATCGASAGELAGGRSSSKSLEDDEHSTASETSKIGRCESRFFKVRIQPPTPVIMDSAVQRHAFANAPLPLGMGSLKARVIRSHRGMILTGHRFSLFIEMDDGNLVFICAGEKQVAKRARGPYYALTSKQWDFDRGSEFYLGRLQGNVLCTQYELHGRPPQSKRCSPEEGREELAMVRFRKPGDAPRSMEIAVPYVEDGGSRWECRPRHRREGLSCAWDSDNTVEANSSDSDGPSPLGAPATPTVQAGRWHRVVSLQPRWDETRQVYTMDFNGRVKRCSSKNFQLAMADHNFKPLEAGNEIAMQFGRVAEDVFSLDVCFPFSPMQALAMSLSMFDSRIAERLRMHY
uniref:Tubby C-terminal domain-containing protein n=1 Tax=Alexandrium monilatum TaxID=311494 RepID=A0A7S4T007_9DINO